LAGSAGVFVVMLIIYADAFGPLGSWCSGWWQVERERTSENIRKPRKTMSREGEAAAFGIFPTKSFWPDCSRQHECCDGSAVADNTSGPLCERASEGTFANSPLAFGPPLGNASPCTLTRTTPTPTKDLPAHSLSGVVAWCIVVLVLGSVAIFKGGHLIAYRSPDNRPPRTQKLPF
jgi:hypothetical protein